MNVRAVPAVLRIQNDRGLAATAGRVTATGPSFLILDAYYFRST